MKSNKQFVLVREDKSLVESYRYRTSFKQKAAAVRLAEKLMRGSYKGEKLVVMEYGVYEAHGYDKLTKKVRNLLSGEEIEISINTPHCCDPSTETYWSM